MRPHTTCPPCPAIHRSCVLASGLSEAVSSNDGIAACQGLHNARSRSKGVLHLAVTGLNLSATESMDPTFAYSETCAEPLGGTSLPGPLYPLPPFGALAPANKDGRGPCQFLKTKDFTGLDRRLRGPGDRLPMVALSFLAQRQEKDEMMLRIKLTHVDTFGRSSPRQDIPTASISHDTSDRA